MHKNKFLSTAKDVVDLEILALKQLKKMIGTSFNQAVFHISNCQSKVILCGVGKSGLIASKIAATLASVGTPSFSMSASEASHGDLGSIKKEDCVIAISNSGETSELNNIIQFTKRFNIKLISITSNAKSNLHKNSTVGIIYKKPKEACPLNLAPTASTAVAMAIGDALASVWMERKGISNADFALNHPSGLLGKKLTLTVEDLMVPVTKLVPLDLDTHLEEIIGIISNNGMGCAYVRNLDNPDLIKSTLFFKILSSCVISLTLDLLVIKKEKISAISSDGIDFEYSVKNPFVFSYKSKLSLLEQVEHSA